jgi:hypothetical protein
MDHAPLDGSGPYQGYADDNVLKALGLQFGQHLRLSPALDLKATYSIRPL